MWADNETSLDLIGFQVHADLIRSIVGSPGMLPVTIGLFGDWGSGKTSIMQMLRQDLDAERWQENSAERKAYEKVACLYFNSWLFEGYDDAKSAILSAILLALGEHKRFGPKVRNGIARLLKSVNWMRAVRMGIKQVALPVLAAFASGGTSVVPSLTGCIQGLAGGTKMEDKEDLGQDENAGPKEPKEADWESLIRKSAEKEGLPEVRSFREQFGNLLRDSDIDSLVVLVDDLDRCSPERVIENLEAIKLFLSVERTAFVIGADPRIVRHAIAWRYQQYGERRADDDGEEERNLVTDYLEKLIQVPYHLPRLSPAETETYMSLLFCCKFATGDQVKQCLDACALQRAKNRYAVFGYGAIKQVFGSLDGDLGGGLALCSQAAPLITEGLKGNPRQIKRFLNALFLRQQLAAVAGLTNIRPDVLIKLMILEYSFDKHFRQLYDWQASQDGHPAQLASMEAAARADKAEEKLDTINKEWNTLSLRKWLTMQPILSGVDLRDYFWVARDRLESTLSGVAMVSPAVRQVAEFLLSGKTSQRSQGMKLLPECTESEIVQLLGLLRSQIARQPNSKANFEAVRGLVDADVPGAAETLAEIITTDSLGSMPASVGMDLNVLLKKKPKLAPLFKVAAQRLRDASNTLIGKAFSEGEKA